MSDQTVAERLAAVRERLSDQQLKWIVTQDLKPMVTAARSEVVSMARELIESRKTISEHAAKLESAADTIHRLSRNGVERAAERLQSPVRKKPRSEAENRYRDMWLELADELGSRNQQWVMREIRRLKALDAQQAVPPCDPLPITEPLDPIDDPANTNKAYRIRGAMEGRFFTLGGSITQDRKTYRQIATLWVDESTIEPWTGGA